MTMEKVNLGDMTGEGFEILCREILSKYYSVEVTKTPLVGDGGKDLIIRTPEPIYVECKHHKGVIGRPVIQKLHSAMVTDWIKKGIVITSGRFSFYAVAHIRENSLPIELIDGQKLQEMAQKVGIKLFLSSDISIEELAIVNPSEDRIKDELLKKIRGIDAAWYR